MAVKVIVEGTGRWVGLPRGEQRAYLLTDVVQRRVDRGFYREVERFEIADHTPPTEPEPLAAAGEQDQPAGESDEPASATEHEPDAAPKPRRSRRTSTDDNG